MGGIKRQMNKTKHKQLNRIQDKARRGKARRGEARQGKVRPGKVRPGKTRQDKARQGKARQDKTRQDKARQDRTGEVEGGGGVASTMASTIVSFKCWISCIRVRVIVIAGVRVMVHV